MTQAETVTPTEDDVLERTVKDIDSLAEYDAKLTSVAIALTLIVDQIIDSLSEPNPNNRPDLSKLSKVTEKMRESLLFES